QAQPIHSTYKTMHDIDSTRLESSQEYNTHGEYEESEAYDREGEATFEMPITEAEEEALAAELLGVGSEAEMDQFLVGLFRKIKRGLGGVARFLNKTAGPLTAALKDLAGKALPSLGGALGTAIPIPGVGTALGTAVGQAATISEIQRSHNCHATFCSPPRCCLACHLGRP